MKHSVLAVLALTAATFTIGCANMDTASNRRSAAQTSDNRIASSEQIDSGLAPVAAPPSANWGSRSHLY